MVPEKKDGSNNQAASETSIPEPPSIHPSFIQVAKPYIFEQTIQQCIAAMGVNSLREEGLRLQGVTWIDNVRRVLYLYVFSSVDLAIPLFVIHQKKQQRALKRKRIC